MADPAHRAALPSVIQGRWHLAEEPVEVLVRTYLDTFDWSVYLAGAALEWRKARPQPSVIWTWLDGTADPLSQVAPARPAFPADLPPGPVRARLLGTLDRRRLLPVMGVQSRVVSLRLCNEDDKTVVRLAIEESRFRDPRTRRGGELMPRLRILPMRGYDDDAFALLHTLLNELAMEPVGTPLLLEALDAAGRQPADYSSKLDYRLDPDARADLATKEILLGLLATLEANIDGARANLDSEFLHDLRVATRRSRSALGQIRGVFPDDQATRFKEELAWLQSVTGPVRDLDVYLLDFDAYRQALPPSLGPDLEPLRDFLHARYAVLQGRLSRALGSVRFRRLRADWRAFLEAPVADGPPGGARPIKEVADERIRALIKRVRREGRSIRSDSPPEDLHELRKSCKKLRYLMEFFQSLYPSDGIRSLIALMKTLLDNLGGYQDLAVQASHLRALAQEMRDQEQAETATLLAMGALIGNLLARQQQLRDGFDQVFGEFRSGENKRAFRGLFGPGRA